MQYLLLIYQDPEVWAGLSRDERNQIHDDCAVWHQELVQSGQARLAIGLQPAATATTVRAKAGRRLTTDGPFAETKEVLGGAELVECQNLDEALAIARRFPALRVGSTMEVRPLVTGPCRD